MELHKPYHPNRNACSLTHDPEEPEHAQKLKEEHMQRLHEGCTKIMIRDRPNSGDRARAQAEALRKVDYQMSTIYEDLLENKGLKFYKNSEGLIEIGDKPSDTNELGRSCSVETMDGKMLDGTLQLIDATGIDYFIGVFKNPSVIEKHPDLEFNKIYQRARLSFKSMMKILLLRNEFYHIDLQYQA